MKQLIIYLLLSASLQAQEKALRTRQGIKLFTVQLHYKKPHQIQTDTIRALITVGSKIKSNHPTGSFRGYVVFAGRRKRYYCEGWEQMPIYYHVRKIEAL